MDQERPIEDGSRPGWFESPKDVPMRNIATGPTAATALAPITANVVFAGYKRSSQIRLSREGSDISIAVVVVGHVVDGGGSFATTKPPVARKLNSRGTINSPRI